MSVSTAPASHDTPCTCLCTSDSSRSRPALLRSFTMPARTAAPPPSPPHDAIFVSVKESAALLGLSRNQTYELLDQGHIESRYFGRRRLVVLSSLRSFADNLPTERAS